MSEKRQVLWKGPRPPLVALRPRCPNCGQRLRPMVHSERERAPLPGGGHTYITTFQSWPSGTYYGYGAFCTLRCAAQFANEAYKAGFKRGVGFKTGVKS